MENEDASHKYAPLFDVYHHLLIVPRIFDCFNQRFLNVKVARMYNFWNKYSYV
jgi:hypothetical protein